jgi:hypothetical protein
MTTRERHFAEYLYPGSFFPESTSREVPAATLTAAVNAGPDEDGYFSKDGWYAVKIKTAVEKLFVADDGDESWIGKPDVVATVIVGDRIHFSEIEKSDRNRILISNIECNSRDGGYGVLTRCGNWQIASDYDFVISASEAIA